MYASAQGVNYEFGDADENATGALVSNAKYLFTVATGNYVDVFKTSELIESFLDLIGLSDVDEAAFRSSKQSTVVRNGFSFRWRLP